MEQTLIGKTPGLALLAWTTSKQVKPSKKF